MFIWGGSRLFRYDTQVEREGAVSTHFFKDGEVRGTHALRVPLDAGVCPAATAVVACVGGGCGCVELVIQRLLLEIGSLVVRRVLRLYLFLAIYFSERRGSLTHNRRL